MVRWAISALLWATAVAGLRAQTNVLTYHNDLARTGQNLAETMLTPQNVNASTFGKLFAMAVDGKVDAQPLYVSALSIPGDGIRNLVFAATEHDSVYAFDADNGTIYWHVSLLQAGETTSDDRGCGQVTPEIGITATPVIDLTAGPHGTIYVVAMSKNSSGSYYQRLHALDIVSGAEEFGGPVTVEASVPGNGDNSSNGSVVFDAKQYKSRPGLLLLNGIVYTGWGSHCDIRPYTGWLIGYRNTTLEQTSVFNFAPNGSEAALWNSGGAPAADTEGNVFVAVANGTFDASLNSSGFPSGGDYGNAFVKLTLENGALAATDYWTMDNSISESNGDIDLGSGGIMLLPDMEDSDGTVRHLAVGAGKDQSLWVVDRDNMGKYDSQANGTIYQAFANALPGGIFSNPAYFQGRVYFGPVGSPILEFDFDAARLSGTPASKTATSFEYPSATPSISANGTSNAILWAVENSTPAVLHAYDATNLSNELYNSNQASSGRDQFGPGNKFITPTIANGKVYVGTTNSVVAFGLLSAPQTGLTLHQISVGADGTLWGVSSSGQIFTYDGQADAWTQISGSLAQIAVGTNGAVWGLNAAGSIFRWNTGGRIWDFIPGNLSQLAVGADGDVWGLNGGSEIYHFDAQSQSWIWIPGELAQISVGYDGAVWGINSQQEIYRFDPGTQRFEQVPGSLTQISVGADGDVWGINSSGQTYHFNRVAAGWDLMPGALAQISVGSGSNVCGVNNAGQVYLYDPQSSGWSSYAGTFAQVSASADGAAWGVESSGQVQQLLAPTQATQAFHQVPGSLTQISVATDGTVWGLNGAGQIWGFDPVTTGWMWTPGTLAEISAGASGNVWGLNGSDQIFRYDAARGNWNYVNGSLSHIATAANGDVWGLNDTGQIYQFDAATQNWRWIPGTLTQIAVGADGAAWGLNSAHQIFQFDAATQNWTYTPGSLIQVAVGSAANVWGINELGGVYRFDSQSGAWEYMAKILSQIAVGFDGAVWGIDAAGQIWEWNAQTQSWSNVPGSLTQIVAAAGTAVWGLDAQGSVYFYR
jgi:hypothetical protein